MFNSYVVVCILVDKQYATRFWCFRYDMRFLSGSYNLQAKSSQENTFTYIFQWRSEWHLKQTTNDLSPPYNAGALYIGGISRNMFAMELNREMYFVMLMSWSASSKKHQDWNPRVKCRCRKKWKRRRKTSDMYMGFMAIWNGCMFVLQNVYVWRRQRECETWRQITCWIFTEPGIGKAEKFSKATNAYLPPIFKQIAFTITLCDQETNVYTLFKIKKKQCLSPL